MEVTMDDTQRIVIEIAALTRRLKTGEARLSMLIDSMHRCSMAKQERGAPIEMDYTIERVLCELKSAAEEITNQTGFVSTADKEKLDVTFQLLEYYVCRQKRSPELFRNIRLVS